MTENQKEALMKQIEKFIEKGYNYAWAYAEGQTLKHALDFRMVTTSKRKAEEKAAKVLTQSEKHPQTWNLRTELLDLHKQ